MTPRPMTTVPRMGTIQCVFASADQPYQNKPTAMKNAPAIIGGSRYSGFGFPPFFATKCFEIAFTARPHMTHPRTEPIPSPKVASPASPLLNPYWPANTTSKVVKHRYR
jgi:hypothetical protein